MAIILTNNTKSNSIVGKLVSISTTDPNAFVYAIPNSSRAIGIVTEAVRYRQKCKIATIGDTAKVLVQGNTLKDDILRGAKSNDNVSLGTCKIAKASDVPYLKVGTALTSGSGLIDTVLELSFVGDPSGVGYVPYTGASQNVDLGTHSITSGSSRTGSATNYTNLDSTGHQTMAGEAKPWDDLRIEPSVRQAAGTGVPTFEKWFDDNVNTSRGVFLYSFTKENTANQKEIFFTMQMPHSWDGGTFDIHVHWTPAATENATEVIWGLEYCMKDIGEVFADTVIVYSSGTLVPDDANITQYKHYISSFAGITPGADANGLSMILIGRVFRRSGDTSDTYTNKVGLLYIDAHYQLNSLGSTDEYIK